jgi:hypothetical protein
MPRLPFVRRVALTRLVVVVVIVAVAIVVYEQTVPERSVVRARLADLVVAPLGLPGYTEAATTAQQVPNASNPFAAVVAAAKVDPDHTGGYFREWKSPASKYKVAEVLAVHLPTTAESTTTLKQAETALLTRTAYAADGYTYGGAIAATTITGSRGAYYEAKATKTTPATTLAVSAFRYGRVVTIIDTVGTDTTGTKGDNVTLARRQQGHLATIEGTFTMVKTSRPALATALFAVTTVAVAGAGGAMVTVVAAVRRRRRARRAARARYEVQVGGQRIVKHRRPTPR